MTAAQESSVHQVMRGLAKAIDGLELPAVEKISEKQENHPFQVLIATLLSARTQDATTLAASTRLFKTARTPRTMSALPVKTIERLIYPVSFYRHKARHVKAACRMLVERFGGRVPSTMEELLTLPGVGRKTANLVLILAFKSERNICVDTHVHRISNRLGWVRTRTPEETEQALYGVTPSQWWPLINLYLVTWGQNVCRPIHPRCGQCAIAAHCPRIGVAPRSGRRSVLLTATAAVLCAVLGGTTGLGTTARAQSAVPPSRTAAPPPALVVETSKGVFEIETFPREAPVTVRHVLALVRAGFYDRQRVHRAAPGFVVQFGDPQTRDASLRHLWGRGPRAGNGTPVGVAEISDKRLHIRGAVSLAHLGVPANAESQMFIALDDRPDLDGRYAVFGMVTVNPDVPGQLQVGDEIVRVSERE